MMETRKRLHTRRAFLRRMGLTGLGGLTAGWYARELRAHAAGDLAVVSLMHTTDLHGNVLPTATYDGVEDVGGLARCASQIRRWRSEHPHSLLVDAGDVYQGTAAGYLSRGRVMIDLFNKLGYDSWTMGNHEFDWGGEAVLDALGRSQMPVLTANLKLDGHAAGAHPDEAHPFANVRPWMIRELDGFRIGLVGLITPGLPAWFHPTLLAGMEATDAAAAARLAVDRMKAEGGVDAIVAVTHFGWRDQDDHANPIHELVRVVPEIDVVIAGHTHRLNEQLELGPALYTQANYFGIHCGRVDLVFDRASRKLVDCRTEVRKMDASVALDPLVLQTVAPVLQEAEAHLDEVVGEIGEDLTHQYDNGRVGQTHRFIGTALLHAARKRGIEAAAVFHGTFGEDPLPAGPVTQRDLWSIIPFENMLVKAELTHGQLAAILEESMSIFWSRRGFTGLVADVGRRGPNLVVEGLKWPDGTPLEPGHRIPVLFNSYDAQSGGRRLLQLRAILAEPAVKPTVEFIPLQTRDALADFLADTSPVRAADLETGGG